MTITSKGKRWELLHSLWLGWVIFSFGLLSWAAFLYIGIRAKQRKWVLWGLAYVAVEIVFAAPLPVASTATFFVSYVLSFSYVVSLIATVHVFHARREYLGRLEALQSSGLDPNTAQKPKIGPQYGANATTATSSEEAAAASSWTSLGQSVPSAQTSKSSQRADTTPSTVDLNSASEQELVTLLGLGTIMAKRAVSFRESQGGFRSVEDFGRVLNLEPEAVERIRALAAVSPSRQPQHPAVSSEQPVTTHDVSEVSALRKRLGRAAFSVKVIGLLSALDVFFYFPGVSASILLLGLALGILVLWCAVRLSRRLRAGETSAAKIVAVWLVLWAAVLLFDALPKTLSNENFDIFSVIGIMIYTLPIYFLTRGLLALRAYKSRLESSSGEDEPLMSIPWEGGAEGLKRHPAFVNKRSLPLYSALLLVPIPYIYVQVSRLIQDDPLISAGQDTQSDLIAEQLGSATAALAIWLPLTVFLYRRARRRALLPAKELSKRNPRPIILYLRSFLDDKLKMRARAANGRSWLERVVKITFEEVITDHLWRYGPVVAIGKPGDKLPPLGAARDYVSDVGWQDKVEEFMVQASIIVVVVGRTEGLAWELDKLIQLGLTRKLILLLPPVQVGDFVGDLPARWDTLCERASEVGLMLPREIDFHRTRAVVFSAGGEAHAIAAQEQSDWAYETVLDAAAELIHPTGRKSENVAATGFEQ